MIDPYSGATEPQQQEQLSDRGQPAEVEERNAPEEANVHATRRFSSDSIGGSGKGSFDSAGGKASMDSKRSSVDDPQLSPRLVDRSGTLKILDVFRVTGTNHPPQRLHHSNHAKEHLAMPILSLRTRALRPARSPLHPACYVMTPPQKVAQQRALATTTASKPLSRLLLRKKRGPRGIARRRRKTRSPTRSKAACSLDSSRARRRTRSPPAGTRASSATWRRCLLRFHAVDRAALVRLAQYRPSSR